MTSHPSVGERGGGSMDIFWNDTMPISPINYCLDVPSLLIKTVQIATGLVSI